MRPENGGFLLKWQKPLEVSADSTATGSDILNAFEGDPTFLFTSQNSTLKVNMRMKEPVNITGFSVVNHNLPETATIKLRYCLDNGYENSIDVEKTISYYKKNTYLAYQEVQQYEYIQLYISSSGPISFGCLFLAKLAFQFPHNYSWGYDDEFEVIKEVDFTDYGVGYEYPNPDNGDDPAYERRKYRINFSDVNREHHEKFFDLIRPGKKVWIPNFTALKCHFGIVPDKKLSSKKNKSGDTYSVGFHEDSTEGQK